jgi:hypothetical protein
LPELAAGIAAEAYPHTSERARYSVDVHGVLARLDDMVELTDETLEREFADSTLEHRILHSEAIALTDRSHTSESSFSLAIRCPGPRHRESLHLRHFVGCRR